ncbi:sensor histidine kinase [Microtetraspora sp. NBRC 16547]|uniref:sensor histidine kinase n=1 Tax=Microtetraspora sp. NBRC 16547 TaxID=3030993 RepID=UPI00249FE74C|nr:sensor histidine kinase [Microtetraspora sp. NBRC 16547]GLX00063.1 two-component sensor histidine kinase [Microtetraspora sp. NBRC 16547]
MSTGAAQARRPLWGRAAALFRVRAFFGKPGGEGLHAWETLRGWETLYALTLGVAIAFLFVDEDLSTTTRMVTLALYGICVAGYLLLGRPAIMEDDDDSRRGLSYVGLLIASFVPATIIAPSSSFALFGLCPQAFMLLRNRYALGVVLVLNAAPAVRFVAAPDGGGMLAFAAMMLIGVTFAAVLGPWIRRIIQQSAERAQLIEELSASRAEIARLSAERGALTERERLAREIHDTLAQGFTSIIMLVQAAEAQPGTQPGSRHLALAVQTARENLAEARALVAALSPAPLDGSTLDEALRRLTARLGEELGIHTTFAVEGASRALPANTEVVLVRAAQEALANVRKHAAASAVQVRVEYGATGVTLVVRDNGRGLGRSPRPGYGLRTMRTRVEQEGGTLTVTDVTFVTNATTADDATTAIDAAGGAGTATARQPATGTTVTVTLPATPPAPSSRDGE